MYKYIPDWIKNIISVNKNEKPDDVNGSISNGNLRQREIKLFGEERLQQQKIYEKWVVKETWNLKSEGLPLMFGLDPENQDWNRKENEYRQAINELWVHAQQCVEQGLLPVKNKLDQPGDWQVIPSDIYRWAIVSRLTIPEAFSTLMQFVLNTIKQPNIFDPANEVRTDDGGGYSNAIVQDKERILGTALAILAAYPDRCRDKQGKVQTNNIVKIINEKGNFWFGDQLPKMSTKVMRDLINRWLQTVN